MGLEIFLFTTAPITVLGPTEPCIQRVPGALSLGAKPPRREADRSPPSSAKVKEFVELHLQSRNTPPWRGAQFKKKKKKGTVTTLPLLLKDKFIYT
jgi:hypothetical protein